jgi:hypothetical protein
MYGVVGVIVSPIGVLADMQLTVLINRALEGKGRVDIVASDTKSALEGSDIRTAAANESAILLLDAQVPETQGLAPDKEEKAALAMLRKLRADAIYTPTLVITPHSIATMATSELADYCNPGTRSILLPAEHLKAPVLEGFIRMLRGPSSPPEPTWDVVEVEVTHQLAKCFLGGRAGKLIEWGTAPTPMRLAKRLALEYAKLDFKQGWARRIHTDGALLFNELVMSTLGRGFFSHLEQAAGGLEKLAFRFRVDDATLYSAPFEAAVRESEQPLSGSENDYNEHPFVLVNAPIARRVKSINLRSRGAQESVPHPARLLFIRSQVGENSADETGSDTLALEEVDQDTGRIRIKHKVFRILENVDRERKHLTDLEAELKGLRPAPFSMEVLDLSECPSPAGAEEALMQELKKPYDIVHFAGHSFTTKGSLTLLVLPSERPGEAVGMDVQSFAGGVATAGARLVYLSSCQGSSANTVASLGQRGVPHVVGFRWDVEDDRAAEFARLFYSDLFAPGSGTVPGAFQAACHGIYQPKRVEASAIWASPILASLSDNWMVQRVL